jgi:UDP-N-acetylmuramate: L-alanyl-gamma-D-glutamyl-meso-diaminopimelate ligase
MDPLALVAAWRGAGRTADHIVEPAEIARKVAAESSSGDVVLVMSNGGFGGLHGVLLDRLAERFGPA